MENSEGVWCADCGHVASGSLKFCPACGGRRLGGAKTIPASPTMTREELGALWKKIQAEEAAGVSGTATRPSEKSPEPVTITEETGDTQPQRPSVGNLVLVETLGKGAWGTVYRGKHKTLGTSYAVKVLHERLAGDEVMIERFRREALTCSSLRHPNLVYVTDFGADSDLGVYLVMEHLEGQNLGERLKAGRIPLWEAAWIAGQLCDGLGAAHAVDTVHRDLKPDNVFLVPRDGLPLVKILDFGIAQLGGQHGALTSAGFRLGTPTYMAPEQLVADRAKIGPRTDIYALGGVLYEMVCGHRPFEGATIMAITREKLRGSAKPVATYRPELKGTRLESLISRTLHTDVDLRPTDTAAVKAALIEALEELESNGIAGASPPDAEETARIPNRRSTVSMGLPAEKDLDPASELRGLVRIMGRAGAAEPVHVLQASVGFVLAEVEAAGPDTERFDTALTVFVSLACMAVANDAIGPAGSATNTLLAGVDEGVRDVVLIKLRPLLRFRGFPIQRLPSWAQKSRSWSGVRQLFARDVAALFKRRDQ